MKIHTAESLIAELIKIRDKGWVPTGRKNNDGGVGNTLEDLLGIPENNLPLANAAEWELKAQKRAGTSLVTLFHTEPSPRTLKFVPSILLPNFGWKHQKAGKEYPKTEKSFRQTINTTHSNRGFAVAVDRKKERVFIDFNFKKIDGQAHAAWKAALPQRKLETPPYWGFNDLCNKAGTKLLNCFFVIADAKRINKTLHFHYQDIYMLKTFDKDKFIQAIEDGLVYVDFDARTGHNHGTKFRLRRDAFIDLYAEVKEY